MTDTIASQLPTGRWQLVNSLSSARFTARNLGAHRVSGHVPITAAWVDINDHGYPRHVRAELDLAGIDTGKTRRDRDLRAPRLLDTDHFPTMTFTSTDPVSTAEGWQLPGQLAAHGHTVDLTLTVGPARETQPDLLTVHASTELDRRDLGITAPSFLIGTHILITIDAAFRRPT